MDAKCGLCGYCSPTVLHILNGCPVALNQSRYTWRHDSVLRKIDQSIRPQLSADESLYTDLRGLKAQKNPTSTVPPNLVVTTARPDMVYVNNDTVVLIELTIPFNSPDSLHNAQARKQNKQLYQQLIWTPSGNQATLVTSPLKLAHLVTHCRNVTSLL